MLAVNKKKFLRYLDFYIMLENSQILIDYITL